MVIEEARRRLADLASADAATADARATCREELRGLKREVLAEVAALRRQVVKDAEKPFGPQPTAGELWRRRDEGARALLADVRQRVTGLVDETKEEAVGGWSEINREIDRRLAELERSAPPASRPRASSLGQRGAGAEDDEIYAAAGAAAATARGECSGCGQRVDPTDRFCRRCGLSLTS